MKRYGSKFFQITRMLEAARTEIGAYRHFPKFGIFVSLSALILFANCSGNSSGGFSDAPLNSGTNPFGSNFQNQLGSGLDNTGPSLASGTQAVGSGPGGTLTSSDKNAVQALTNSMDNVNPTPGDPLAQIPPELLAQLQALVQQQQQGHDVAVQKLLLIGQIVAGCARNAAILAPKIGQTLRGDWAGTCTDPKDKKHKRPLPFQISVTGDGPFIATATFPQGAQDQLSLTSVGYAQWQNKKGAGSWQGQMIDQPTAGTGQYLVQNTAAKYVCRTGITLQHSTNPIPENYVRAMRNMGACLRQALVALSPVMDDMFKNMDPQLAAVLRSQMLGLPAH